MPASEGGNKMRPVETGRVKPKPTAYEKDFILLDINLFCCFFDLSFTGKV